MKKLNQKSKGLLVLLGTEMPELFGRFTISALLVLYLTKTFQFTDSLAFGIYCTFIALIFVTPILGGYISDKILGHHHAIILGGITMAIGNLLMVIPTTNMVTLWPCYHYNR